MIIVSFYEVLMDKLTRYFNQKGHFDFNEAVLFDFQNSKQKTQRQPTGNADR